MNKIITVLIFSLIFFCAESNAQINSFPYIEQGDNPVGWNAVQGIPIWSLGTSYVNPTGKENDAALICNFFAYAPGPDGYIISPVYDFTALTHPVVHFYVSYASYDDNNDSMQFLVSTDFGNTFVDLPVSYRKSFNQSPSYATVPSQDTIFSPTSKNQWRHETIDLGAFAGQNNLLFAFRGVCAYGNNLFIDNFVTENADVFYMQNISTPGDYLFDDMTITFNTVGLPPVSGKIESDNPGGGEIKVTEHLNQNSVLSLATPEIKANSTATTQDGSVFTPENVFGDKWFTISYTGNDWSGNAVYDISIDLSSFSTSFEINKLYLVKRSDYTDSWECLNTIVEGNSLKATGLTSFSDIGVAGNTSLSLSLKYFLEGFFNGNSMITDTVKVNVRSQISPYHVIDVSSSVLNSSGVGNFTFPIASANTCYYFEVIHRNHIRVFSTSLCQQWITNNLDFDFTDSQSKTYGNNSVFIPGSNSGYASYTGDVNQDDFVDLTDYSVIDNDAFNFVSGYAVSDVNGDGVVGITDMTFCDNNSFNFISSVIP